MSSFFYKYCCCCVKTALDTDNQYEEVQLEESGNEDGIWELSLMGFSSDDESDDELNVEMYVLSEEDSVDDKEYYRSYTANLHLPERLTQYERPKSTRYTIECILAAQAKATECIDSMRRTDYLYIRAKYEEALEACPRQHKQKIIREYELFKDMYSRTLNKNNDEEQLATAKAESYWYIASVDMKGTSLEKQQEFYRLAIMCMPEPRRKAQWKRAYNDFLKSVK